MEHPRYLSAGRWCLAATEPFRRAAPSADIEELLGFSSEQLVKGSRHLFDRPRTQNFLPCRVPSAWNNWQSSQLKRKLDSFVDSRVGLSPQPFPSQQICVQARFFLVSTAGGRKLFVRISRGAALLHSLFQRLPSIRRVCSLKTWLGMYFTLRFPNS